MTRGVIEAPTVFFFVSLIVLCLWINVQNINANRA